MRGTGGPFNFKSVLFTLHHDLQEKEPKLQNATMMSMKVHVSSLHAPIYRNFCLCVGKKPNSNISMLSDPWNWKSVRPTGLPVHRALPPKLSGELSSQAPYEKKINSGAQETPTMPIVYRRSSRCFNGKKKLLVKTYKHTLILFIFQNRYPFQWRNLSSSIWV